VLYWRKVVGKLMKIRRLDLAELCVVQAHTIDTHAGKRHKLSGMVLNCRRVAFSNR
jgi:hypothetical protein